MSNKYNILNRCKLQPYDKHKFILLEDFKYKDHVVPKGFITDGATIPRIFWFIYPPNRPDYLPAAVIHDYLCEKEMYKEADSMFKNCLSDLEIHKFTINTFYIGVITYHYLKYNMINNIKNDILDILKK